MSSPFIGVIKGVSISQISIESLATGKLHFECDKSKKHLPLE